MKYTIETTDYGCIETFEFSDGKKYIKRSERTNAGCIALDEEFSEQMEEEGVCEEFLDKVYDNFDGFLASEFLQLAELEC